MLTFSCLNSQAFKNNGSRAVRTRLLLHVRAFDASATLASISQRR
jgi:hypothetical protein